MQTAERKRLFENLVRVRRAARELPASADLAAVRADLERQLGPTVSRTLAAELLGLSHTALNRWIASGDVPVVVTPAGRREVPVAALLDLHEAVDRQRSSGRRRRHLLEPTMLERRERARALRPQQLVAPEEQARGTHRAPELRSLAYHRAVAERLTRPMVAEARQLVRAWRDSGRIDPRYASRWERVLDRSLTEIRDFIAEDTETAAELRQSSPFAGALSEPERRKILAEVP